MDNMNSRTQLPRSTMIALAVAAIAVLVAAGATVAAFLAVSRAGSAPTSGRAAPEVPLVGRSGEDGKPVEPERVTTESVEPSPVRPAPDFTLFYEKVSLKIPASAWCAQNVSIDLDGPRIDAGSPDLTRYGCASPDRLEFDAVSVSAEATPESSASECMEKIELAPLREGANLPVSSLHPGSALCMLTNRESAVELGFPQRIALMEIKGIDDDQTLAVVVTAWNVPD